MSYTVILMPRIHGLPPLLPEWIENDWTDEGLANELVEKRISAQNVVLAFHPPDMRIHTEFAAA